MGAGPRRGLTLSEPSSGPSWQQRRHRKDLGSRHSVCRVLTKYVPPTFRRTHLEAAGGRAAPGGDSAPPEPAAAAAAAPAARGLGGPGAPPGPGLGVRPRGGPSAAAAAAASSAMAVALSGPASPSPSAPPPLPVRKALPAQAAAVTEKGGEGRLPVELCLDWAAGEGLPALLASALGDGGGGQ